MEKAGWLPVSQTAPELNSPQPSPDGQTSANTLEWQAVDSSLPLLCWCGAVLTAALLAWLALSSASPFVSSMEERAMRLCPSEQSLSASLNIKLLHQQVLRKLHSVPAQPTVGGRGGRLGLVRAAEAGPTPRTPRSSSTG